MNELTNGEYIDDNGNVLVLPDCEDKSLRRLLLLNAYNIHIYNVMKLRNWRLVVSYLLLGMVNQIR